MKWISVDEKLPNDQQEVLTYWPRFGQGKDQIQVQRFYKNYSGLGSWWMYGWQNHQLKNGRITYWMPLPEFPEKKR